MLVCKHFKNQGEVQSDMTRVYYEAILDEEEFKLFSQFTEGVKWLKEKKGRKMCETRSCHRLAVNGTNCQQHVEKLDIYYVIDMD